MLPVPASGNPPVGYALGSILSEEGRLFSPAEQHLEKHLAVLGGTGSGKSKFLELLMRQLHLAKRGFCLIDPHGDLSEDLLAFFAKRRIDLGTDVLCKIVHYLEPGYDVLFGYDPFQFRPSRPIPEAVREQAYQAWLHTKVDRVSEIIQRKQGQTDFEGMPRLQRVLRDVLYACGIAVDADGNHLPLSDALVLLDIEHPRHGDVFARVSGILPREILSDFERLQAYRRVEDRLRETESTINRLRSVFSPILQAIFSRTEHTVDVRSIIQRREILLVNLRETEYFSADQANALGGLFIHQILSTAATTDRDMRVPYYLIIDEAARFIGDDLERALGECRKYKLSVCLAAQDLSSFVRKDFDMSRKVLSQCRTQICFQQQHPEDLEILARVLGYGNLDFTELLQVADRPDGYDWIEVDEHSESTSQQTNRSRSESRSETESTSEQTSHSVSSQEGWQLSESRQVGNGTTQTYGTSRSVTEGKSTGTSHGTTEGSGTLRSGSDHVSHSESHGTTSSRSQGQSRATTVGSSESYGTSRTETEGTSRSISGGRGTSEGKSQGTSHAVGRTVGESTGESEGTGRSISHKRVPLARHREEWHRTGRMERSVDDQLHGLMQLLHSLPTRCALVKLVDQTRAFPIKVNEVTDPFASAAVKSHAVEQFKHRLYEVHPYFFQPVFGRAEQDRRLSEFVAGGRLPRPEPQKATRAGGATNHPQPDGGGRKSDGSENFG